MMTLEKVFRMLEKEYERAKKLSFVQKPLAWALYQVLRRADRGLLEKIPQQPTAPTLMPMGALTYAIACSHCTRRKGSPLCDDCICEVTSWFELDPDTVNKTINATVRECRTVQNNKEETEMKQYIGTKMVKAAPALRLMDGKGNNRIEPLSSNPLPQPGDSVEVGYKVIYEDGYESWSPQDVFDAAYRETTGMPFGLAIEAAKKGKRIARAGWNGKNQYVELAYCISYKDNAGQVVNVNHCNIGNKALAFVGTSGVQMGWLASQADMLADDWMIVE